ncbi:MAG: preprotein translocase subunit SecE [Vicinamibacterales bacterium]|nr:preprotein translocase subunit SecE [Vicinamibacterales bacterium]
MSGNRIVKTETIDDVKGQPPATTGEGGPRLAPVRWWGRAGEFLGEVRSELKRVTWPTRTEVYATTIVVIVTSVFFGLYLFGIDLVLNAIVQRIFSRFGAA